jgi:hypothetical protein
MEQKILVPGLKNLLAPTDHGLLLCLHLKNGQPGN